MNEATGHYTQMLWAETRFLGCGQVSFPGGMGVKKLIVCNYGPSGNVDGKLMYRAGKKCAKCPKEAKCTSGKMAGLCGEQGCQSSSFPFLVNPGS